MPLEMLTQQWPLLFGLVLFGALVYWVADEWAEADGAADAVSGAGKRADRVTGEFLGAFGALVASVAMIGMTIGQQLLQTASMLEPILGQVPAVIGQLVVAGLGYLTLRGVIGLSAQQYGWIVLLITIVVLFIRFGGD